MYTLTYLLHAHVASAHMDSLNRNLQGENVWRSSDQAKPHQKPIMLIIGMLIIGIDGHAQTLHWARHAQSKCECMQHHLPHSMNKSFQSHVILGSGTTQ